MDFGCYGLEYSSFNNIFLITRVALHQCKKFIFILFLAYALSKLGTITRRSIIFFKTVFLNFYTVCAKFALFMIKTKIQVTSSRAMMWRLLSKQTCAKDSLQSFKRQEELLKNSNSI